jgi:hypothetical protein
MDVWIPLSWKKKKDLTTKSTKGRTHEISVGNNWLLFRNMIMKMRRKDNQNSIPRTRRTQELAHFPLSSVASARFSWYFIADKQNTSSNKGNER